MPNEAPRSTPPPATPPPEPMVPLVIGARRQPVFRDLYFWFLRVPWSVALAIAVAVFLVGNALFAALYLVLGGVSNMRAGSFADAYYFSVHTMATIGYGDMVPVSTGANVVVIAEAIVGLLYSAIATGLVFAKFSKFAGRVVFTNYATVFDFNGVPTVGFRIGNDRDNQIVEVTVRVAFTKTEKTKEGVTFYRLVDLELMRDRAPALSRSWSAMHAITESSPLYGLDAAEFKRIEGELWVSIAGTDDTSLQLVHARHNYGDEQILWGYRHADVLSEDANGRLILDITKFHDVVEAPLTLAPPRAKTE